MVAAFKKVAGTSTEEEEEYISEMAAELKKEQMALVHRYVDELVKLVERLNIFQPSYLCCGPGSYWLTCGPVPEISRRDYNTAHACMDGWCLRNMGKEKEHDSGGGGFDKLGGFCVDFAGLFSLRGIVSHPVAMLSTIYISSP